MKIETMTIYIMEMILMSIVLYILFNSPLKSVPFGYVQLVL